MADRYDTSQLTEDQHEPGSDGTVLHNLLGIRTRYDMEIAETAELWLVQEKLLSDVSADQSFSAEDICQMHRAWLGKIYPWAGMYRQVNFSKGGFDFAKAMAIHPMMVEFEGKQLKQLTPCISQNVDEVAYALAEVHVELMLIHPFREGNGRIGRLLAILMALQAGLPPLEFSEMTGERKNEYFAAVRAGLDKNYLPMKNIFSDVIERTVWLYQEI